MQRGDARLIPSESTTEINIKDAEDLTTEEFLAIVRAGHRQSQSAEPNGESDDEVHWKGVAHAQSATSGHSSAADKFRESNGMDPSPLYGIECQTGV